MIYCFDTSTFMDAWVRWYPPDHFPALWQRLDDLIDQNRLISSDEVLREIERKEDALHVWANARKALFWPIDTNIQTVVSQIMAQFPKLVDERTGKSFGDPFVIATAKVNSAIVVTGESTGTPTRPKIPTVCDYLEIGRANIVDVIRREGWTF